MSVIYSDPHLIKGAAADLSSYADFLEGELSALKGSLNNLSYDWRDQQFQEFRTHFDGTSLMLSNLIERIRTIKPVLLEDARRLEEFQAKNPPMY